MVWKVWKDPLQRTAEPIRFAKANVLDSWDLSGALKKRTTFLPKHLQKTKTSDLLGYKNLAQSVWEYQDQTLLLEIKYVSWTWTFPANL